MHIDHLAVPFLSTDNRRHQYEGVFGHEIADTSLIIRGVTCMRLDFKLERRRQRKPQRAKKNAEV